MGEDSEQVYREDIVDYLEKYDRFICKIAYNVTKKCPKVEFEDAKQQLILSLIISYKKYDINKNTSIATYLSQIVMNAASNIVRSYWQVKNRAYIECVSLDSYVSEDDEECSYLDFIYEEDESFHPNKYVIKNELLEKIKIVLENVRPFEKKVFMLYLDGLSIEKIGKKTRRSKKTIYNVISCIKEKIKKIM